MRIRIILFSLISLIVFPFCKTEKTCPAFKTADLENIAYKSNDTLKFVNAQSDEFDIFIKEIKLSDAFDTECRDLYKVCPCINYAEVSATDIHNSTEYVFLKMEQSDVSDMQCFKCNVIDFYFELDFNNEVQNADQFPYLAVENIIIDSVLYKDVVVYSNLDDQSSTVSKVYLTKKFGVLRITMKNGIIWNRVF